RSSTRTNSFKCSVLLPSITAPSRCSSVHEVPPGSRITGLPPSSKIPTCIEARVRSEGLKKTSAIDFPASGLLLSPSPLRRIANSTSSSRVTREKSVVRKKEVIRRLLESHERVVSLEERYRI